MFGTLALVDFFAAKVPTYFLLKTAALLFLSLPQFNGAAYVYDNYAEPLALKVDQAVRDVIKSKGY